MAQRLVRRDLHGHLQEKKHERMFEVRHGQSHCSRQLSPSKLKIIVSWLQVKYASEISKEQSGFVKGKVSERKPSTPGSL